MPQMCVDLPDYHCSFLDSELKFNSLSGFGVKQKMNVRKIGYIHCKV